MRHSTSTLKILGIWAIGFSTDIFAMGLIDLDPDKKKDFLMVKNEIIKRVGKDFRRQNPYLSMVRLNREVMNDTSLGTMEQESPFKNAPVDKMFHTKNDVQGYLLFKRDDTNAWVKYTQKFLNMVNMDQYQSHPTFSKTPFPTIFKEFLDYKTKEFEKWGQWLQVYRHNPSKLLLAPKQHPHSLTGVDELQRMGLNGKGTEVCVWDCGFFENKHVNYVRDIETLPGNEVDEKDPGNANHGTHVSGIIGAKLSAGNAHGVAPGANIYPISYTGINSFIEEIQDSKAKVINGSFSFLLSKNKLGDLGLLAEELKKNDRLLVMASGNSSKFLNDPQPMNFQNFWSNGMWVGPHYPFILSQNEELAKRLILVGSMKEDGVSVSRFSNLPGLLPQHFIFAPGENVNSTVRDDEFDRYSGTSMAAPHVTGIIALLNKSFPKLKMTEIKDIVLNTGDPFWNDDKNKFSHEYDQSVHGRGRINALKAYRLAQQKSLISMGNEFSMKDQFELANQNGLAHGIGRLWINAGVSPSLDDMDMSQSD